ncbi:histone promoter control 2 [Dothidotthia symphoricarpi CBS 119687]|uniref:Histone promoter control 2 n=1 Tax=Dothidotthia symphoricarpi CBS 119687 TaxID=1392245 RepID=A0A6A6AGK7_9PLEO|nr:histone promoter control 2 [Dothidotthia symphoricarpi CBS 119687]KAF2130054.1 histone promoter control 2 [Dothidotthia symphoricarpi CBS 119687]
MDSDSLSSAPHSPSPDHPHSPPEHSTPSGGGVNTSTSTPASAASKLTASGVPRKKPGPKPKTKDVIVPEPEKKPRKARKPAEPKDPGVVAAPRKRRTKASLEAQASPAPQVVDEKPPVQQSPAPQTKQVEPVPAVQPEQIPVVVQPPRMVSNEPTLHSNPNLSHINVAPSTPRPLSSGQRYDPIRGDMFEQKPPAPASAPQPLPPPPISPPLNRASASPSITSLIDPPSASNSFYSQAPKLQQQISVTSAPASPAAFPPRPGPVLPSQDIYSQQKQQPQPSPQPYPATPAGYTPMEIDSHPNKPASIPMTKVNSANSGTPSNSNAPTPPTKAARQKETPLPLPSGSGLLSGTAFGSVANLNGTSETPGTNIYLTFDLKGKENVTINFAREVEKEYGFAALHPRIAARRERQRQIDAASTALERAAGGGSNDDMSVDLSDNESNVEMGGMDDETSARENGGKKRRKRKQEEYDKEDDFIDDTELAWEQQALMAKDGFFVYSGPLVTEDKPAVERADGTVRRGRGRGRGGTTRGDAAGRGRGRGGGPGSRGGSTVRKPRVTKADRAMMEQEKQARESQAAMISTKPPVALHTGQNGAA